MSTLGAAGRGLRARIERADPRLAELLDHPLAIPLLAGVPLCLLIAFLVSTNVFPGSLQVRQGQISQSVVEAPRTVQFISQVRTEQAREQAASQVKDIFDQTRTEAQQQQVAQADQKVEAIRHGSGTDASKVAAIEDLKLGLPQPQNEWLETSDDASVDSVFSHTSDVVGEVMTGGIRSDTLDVAQKEAANRASALDLPDPEGEMVRALAPAYLAVNYEAQATQDARTRAMDSVSPVVVQVNQGERILDFGQKVSQYDMEVLSAEGLVHSALDVQNLIGALILALILLALTAGYVMRYRTDLLRRRELLGLVALVDVAVLLVAKILVPAHPYGQYMVPMAAAPILVATLLDARLGLLNALGLGLLTGILAGNIAELTVLGFAGPALGILAMRRTESMAQLLRAGFLVALASFFALYGIGLLERRLPQQQLSEVSLIAGTASFVGTVLAIGMFNWLGELFGIATPTRLLELSNPSNPLLKRLMIQAPGTYNHSLMVGNLVEAAAPLVGADPLIARLGAYFHDIGKTRRPQFFVENQATTGNIHQTLPPATSAAILDSHVIEGVELVEQYHFPQIIRDIVAQHQGTGVKTYFYRQALEKDPATPIDAYRYPGPKPQTKEAALVMLADGVEASCRTLADPSSDAIRNQVERIARTVVQDGQLDECDLTFRDIDRITETFQNLMVNIHHQRVVYPEGPGAGSRFGGGMASAGPALPTPATPVISAPGAGRRRDKRVAAQDR